MGDNCTEVEASNGAPSLFVIWLWGEGKRTNGNVSYGEKGPALLKSPPGPSSENDWVVFGQIQTG